MNWKDVAHLYIGCKVQYEDLWSTKRKKTIITDFTLDDDGFNLLSQGCKPLLYPLSALSDEQKLHLVGSELYSGWESNFKIAAKSVHYLLSQNFDLFNLIEQGEAIDVTTLDIDPYKGEVK